MSLSELYALLSAAYGSTYALTVVSLIYSISREDAAKIIGL